MWALALDYHDRWWLHDVPIFTEYIHFSITSTGSNSGLKLELNIEQYEFMKGPNDGAGIKILVHEPNDIPLVRDHGLAVPTGMHAFVALKIVEVIFLNDNNVVLVYWLYYQIGC